MKKRIVALLVLLAMLCSATVASAAVVQPPVPSTNAANMSVPSGVDANMDLAYITNVKNNGNGTYTVTFKDDPFKSDQYKWDENGKPLSGNLDTNVALIFNCTDGSNHWDNWYYIYAQDLVKTNGVYTATIDISRDDGYSQTFERSNIWRTVYNANGYYQVDNYYDANHKFSNGSLSVSNGDWEDMENYSHFTYSYAADGSLTWYDYSTRTSEISLNYNRKDGDLQSYSTYTYMYDENGREQGEVRISYTPYGVVTDARYDSYDGYGAYYWDSRDKVWYRTNNETGKYETLSKIDGVSNPDEVKAPITQEMPTVKMAKKTSELGSLPFSLNDVASVTSYSIKNGVMTVTLNKDIRALAKAYADSLNSASAKVEVGYYYDGEYHWPDAVISEDGLTATVTLPEGAEILDVNVYGNFNIDGYSYYYSVRDDGTSYVSYNIKGVGYSYNYDKNGKITSTYVNIPGDKEYSFYYNEKGALESYSYEVSDGLNVTFDASNRAIFAYYVDPVTGDFYNWDSKVGWFEYGAWNEETGEWEKIPVAGPEGVEDPGKVKSMFGSSRTWYPNNTVGVLGLSLRDDLGITDKWYNVVPIDLTVDGTQTVGMVASNLFYFGSATITVADGNVTVDYKLPKGHAYLKSECLQWFTSLDEISSSFLANPVGEYAFGEPVSISEKLGDADVALLFICNRVTYGQPITNGGAMLTRYYRNLDEWKNWRAYLTSVLESMDAAE